MKLRLFCLTAIALCLGASATAQIDLYDDGPTDGTTDAWTFNFGFSPSDTFTLANAAHVSGLEFVAWLFPGDVLQSVEISVSSEEFGGTEYFDQVVDTTQSGCALNGFSFEVCTETAVFDGPSLNAGMYWLTLQNGVLNNDDPVYWDENGGPSSASVSSLGTIPGESFTLLGSTGSTTTTGTTPEPGGLLLFGSGLLGVMAILRRKFGR